MIIKRLELGLLFRAHADLPNCTVHLTVDTRRQFYGWNQKLIKKTIRENSINSFFQWPMTPIRSNADYPCSSQIAADYILTEDKSCLIFLLKNLTVHNLGHIFPKSR